MGLLVIHLAAITSGPVEINGIVMGAFFAGRAETGVRRTVVPGTYLDIPAQFPGVSYLLTAGKSCALTA